MNERIKDLAVKASLSWSIQTTFDQENLQEFAELIIKDMHKKVIASILITDVTMEEKGQVPTSEDYIHAINKHFGIE